MVLLELAQENDPTNEWDLKKKIILKEISNYTVKKNYQGFHPDDTLHFIKSLR